MSDHRYLRSSYVLGLTALLCLTTGAWSAQVRVATYNLQSLSTDVTIDVVPHEPSPAAMARVARALTTDWLR
jgi:hypothetical protein